MLVTCVRSLAARAGIGCCWFVGWSLAALQALFHVHAACIATWCHYLGKLPHLSFERRSPDLSNSHRSVPCSHHILVVQYSVPYCAFHRYRSRNHHCSHIKSSQHDPLGRNATARQSRPDPLDPVRRVLESQRRFKHAVISITVHTACRDEHNSHDAPSLGSI